MSGKIDGAHVFVNNKHVGVIDKTRPHVMPFIPAGVHLVEVRKIGYARWGKLVTLENGKSKKLKARLKRAKNHNQDYLPLARLHLRGEEAFSDAYLVDFFYEHTQKFKVNTLITGYLEPVKSDQTRLTILTFRDDTLERRFERTFSHNEFNAYIPALETYWKRTFGFDLKAEEITPAYDRWMPTFFKVE